MNSIVEMLLTSYENERFYNQKKAEYLIRFIPLIMVYIVMSIILSQTFASNGYSEVIEGIIFIIMLLLLAILIYMRRVEWAVNLFILSSVVKAFSLMRQPIALHFSIYVFIMLLITAVVHVEKYQLVLGYSVFNGVLIYRVISMWSASLNSTGGGMSPSECVYTFFGSITLTIGVNFLMKTIDREINNSEMLERASETDTLTGLPNRRRFENLFVKKYTGYEKCVLLMDLDYFKKVNDQYGHQEGDKVLIQVAEILRDSIRNSDAVFRWGGEEFVMILRGVSEALGCAVADRIRQSIATHDFGLGSNLTVSIGLLHIGTGASVELLNNYLRRADRALYRAKNDGRNRVVLDHKFKLMPVEVNSEVMDERE